MRSFIGTVLALVPLASCVAIDTRQTAPTTFLANVEQGINTECKKCPYSQCANVAAYEGSSAEFTVDCWTEGDAINGDTLWLRSTNETESCYVTYWDIVEYTAGTGDLRQDLPSCGAPIPKTITTSPSRTVYNTECVLSPSFATREDRVKMYKPEVDITLTCKKFMSVDVIGDDSWYKTLSNCYVSGAQIEFVETQDVEDCGPVPFLEAKMREPDPVSPSSLRSTPLWGPATNTLPPSQSESDLAPLNPRSPSSSSPSPQTHPRHSKRWLYTTRIGGDSANCTTSPSASSPLVREIPFGRTLIIQCAEFGPEEEGRVIYLLTTDFCWVPDEKTEPGLTDSVTRSERYPACSDFVDVE